VDIWIIGIGEPAIPPPNTKLGRYGVLTRHLASRGHRVTWWGSDFSHITKQHVGSPNEHLRQDGVDLVLVHAPAYKRNVGVGRLVSVAAHARNLARHFGAAKPPDIILSAMPTIEASDVAVEFGKQADIPVVLDIRDEWPEDYVRWLPPTLRPLGRFALTSKFSQLRRACGGATAIFGVSEKQLAYGLAHAGRLRRPDDAVVYLGARPTVVPAEEGRAIRKNWENLGIQDGKFTCVYSGTMSPSRPLGPVIDAVKRLSDKNVPIVFIIAGTGDQDAEYRRKAADHPAIRFAGWINHREMAVLFDMADVAIAPYRPDLSFSLPTKMFDYMAGGLPIVSSCGGEAAALIDRHQIGINYDVDDSASVERALSRLYEDAELRRLMSSSAKALLDKQFHEDAVLKHFANCLESMANVSAMRRNARCH
jgi:glycosyltransferase involved in cell wall biosynthesis